MIHTGYSSQFFDESKSCLIFYQNSQNIIHNATMQIFTGSFTKIENSMASLSLKGRAVVKHTYEKCMIYTQLVALTFYCTFILFQ